MSLNTRNISVVLPSYNERENVPEAMRRIAETLGDRLLEIIIVDDNSPDRTWEVVEEMHKSDPRFTVMRRMNKRGLASALADGTKAAKGDIIVWLDCDLGIPPEDINKLVEKLPAYDVAIGSRYVPGGMDTRNKFRGFLSYLFNIYTRMVLGRHFWDWTSGFAAATKDAMRKCPLSEDGFGEYFIEWVYVCTLHNIKMIEVPYRYGLRKAGESKTDGDIRVFIKLALTYVTRVVQIRMKHGSRLRS